MYNSQFGNNFLYLLSEKKSISRSQSKEYVEILKKQENNLGYNISSKKPNSIIRKLSSLGYLDVGENEKGKTIVQVAPPMLVELPFIQLSFLLTGARSPDFLEAITNAVKGCSEVKIKKQTDLPDTVIIESESQTALKKSLECSRFQGNKLSSYIQISKQPVAWDILEFSGDLESYEQSLNSHWCSGSRSDIKRIFDVDFFRFKEFNPDSDRLEKDLSLVEIIHYDSFSKYYLFKKENNDRVKVDLDWGRLLMTKQSNYRVLRYNKQIFELSSDLRLPLLWERGLALLSGCPPTKLECYKNTKTRGEIKLDGKKKRKIKGNNPWIFKNVPYKIAKLVSNKLSQDLEEV